MAGASIKLEISGPLMELLTEAVEAEKFREYFKQELEWHVSEQFETSGAHGGDPWKPSARVLRGWAYRRNRVGEIVRRKGKAVKIPTSNRTLDDTGELRKSVRVRIEPTMRGVAVTLGFGAKSKKGDRYGATHMRGRHGLPVRNPGLVNKDSEGKGIQLSQVKKAFMIAIRRYKL